MNLKYILTITSILLKTKSDCQIPEPYITNEGKQDAGTEIPSGITIRFPKKTRPHQLCLNTSLFSFCTPSSQKSRLNGKKANTECGIGQFCYEINYHDVEMLEDPEAVNSDQICALNLEGNVKSEAGFLKIEDVRVYSFYKKFTSLCLEADEFKFCKNLMGGDFPGVCLAGSCRDKCGPGEEEQGKCVVLRFEDGDQSLRNITQFRHEGDGYLLRLRGKKEDFKGYSFLEERVI